LIRFGHRPWEAVGILLTLVTVGMAQTQDKTTAQTPANSLPGNSTAGQLQSTDFTLLPGEDPENRLVSPFLKHLAGDQKQFWTSPTRFRVKDLQWIAPFTGVTAAFLASDSWWGRQVNPAHMQTSLHISDYGAYSLIGLGGSAFLLGHITHDEHMQESGLLSGEAAINATAVAYLFKEITQRPRPYQDDGSGHFFTGGASFPSEHSAIAWSIASVFAHEYPGWFTQMAAYGLATTISATRVTAKQHFPSDVIVGGAMGWVFGRQVYRAHHDPELGGSGWGSSMDESTGEKPRNPDYMASPYIELDSWIYPAMLRLIALGYIKSPILGMRPWTRMQCARVLEDAQDRFPDAGVEEGDAGRLYATLTTEFAAEIARLDGGPNVGAKVDSVYTRATEISGPPLRDSFHFGQTIVNDFGRPYWEGFNDVTGVIADATAGPVSFFFRGEYQHSPAMPSYSGPVLSAIAAADFTPALPNGNGTIDRFQLLDSMASVNVDNVQFSVGMQSEWLGPGEDGPLLMSNNSPPFPTFKVDDIAPHDIPGLSRILGPMRTEFFIGQLSGQHWEFCQSCPQANSQGVVGPNINPQPFIHGEKISFQPTPNFEFGMGITAMFGGPGLPVTFGNFFRTYYVHSSTATNNPGKRISAADLTYRIPGWLTFYMDSLVVDEISPIGSTRANINPGIYLPRIPKIHKLELRAEGINESRTREFSPGFVYADYRRFLSGYTNDDYLIGSWIGRAGRGVQGWLTYSFSPRTRLQAGYRLQTVAKDFIGGGRLADYSATGDFMLSKQVALSGVLQYEQWAFPVLASGRHSNVITSLQFTFRPRWSFGR
jgi:hypothetical protein